MASSGKADGYQHYARLTPAEVQQKVRAAQDALFDAQQALAWAPETADSNLWTDCFQARLELGKTENSMRRANLWDVTLPG